MTEENILECLRVVIDPEIGINIVDLGLIYGVEFPDEKSAKITLTMTSMGCPLHAFIQDEVKKQIKRSFPEIENSETNLVWEPVWSQEMMSEAAKKQLGW